MNNVEVFDPPMCCSTGVCGPNVDPALARFSADLHWLTNEGVHVERYNLSQQPQVFADLPYATDWFFLCDSVYFIGSGETPGSFSLDNIKFERLAN